MLLGILAVDFRVDLLFRVGTPCDLPDWVKRNPHQIFLAGFNH